MMFLCKQPNIEYVFASLSPYTELQITSIARVDHARWIAQYERILLIKATLGSFSAVLSSPIYSGW